PLARHRGHVVLGVSLVSILRFGVMAGVIADVPGMIVRRRRVMLVRGTYWRLRLRICRNAAGPDECRGAHGARNAVPHSRTHSPPPIASRPSRTGRGRP